MRRGAALISRAQDRVSKYLERRGRQQHEYDVYLAHLPVVDNLPGVTEQTPVLTKINPRPRVKGRPLDVPTEDLKLVRLQRYEVSRITRQLTEADLRAAYFLVVEDGVSVTPEKARDKMIPRYRMIQNSTPELFEGFWRMTLVEDR